VKATTESPKVSMKARVFVVEDDPSMRGALSSLIRSVEIDVQTFPTASDFLRHSRPEVPACLVLDVRLPGMSGLLLQSELARMNDPIPIIFITSHADVPMCARAMKLGAVEFLPKPFRDQDLLEAIEHALQRDCKTRAQQTELVKLRASYGHLTPREREVMRLVARGLLNKQTAAELGTSEVTVKIQRASAMRKMGAETVVDLAKMSTKLGLSD
jgi:FixJ family two-component response regulator